MAGLATLAICDAHMHCWDQHERVTKFNNHILGDCGTYLPENYRADLGELQLRSCVHVEAFPTDQVEETRWIDSLRSAEFPLRAIVANANISLQKENERSTSMQGEGLAALLDVLQRHAAASRLLRGVRWVLNHEPSWPQVHRGDYFEDPLFRRGFEQLEKHSLSFDLQCNPHQLEPAAAFFRDFPAVPVVLDHLGSPRLEGGLEERDRHLAVWRAGMKAVAALPHVHCKLSFLAYSVTDWWKSEEGKAMAKSLLRETIAIFGAERCMFASNFPAEDAASRAGLYAFFQEAVSDLPPEVREGLFFRNAERFYRIEA